MSTRQLGEWGGRGLIMSVLLVAGMFFLSCSSAPKPQPEPTKQEIKKDADRFFEKMKKEENQSPYPE